MEESQYSMVTEAPGVTTLGAAMISSRLSYFLDLRGPTLATNTACSSGLVALHQAVSSLQQGECEAALAASVSLSLSHKPWMKMSEAGMLSPDGLCRSFSKHADGIGIGEAVVALLVMPLQVALDRGLPVYGVIRGSGINFDGKTNGVTAPNGRAQEQLIEMVYTRHGIDARDVSHVIAHGTGTRLGDPVELNALHNAFKTLAQLAADDGKAALPCAVTSVKSNLGHTMAASGLVSLAALLQGIVHRQIPATLHCEEDNDYIAWRDSRLYVNKATRAWDVPGDRLRLGAVSAFGRSGTNAHVVIEEFRDPRPLAATEGACLVPPARRGSAGLSAADRDDRYRRRGADASGGP
jgi:acyl transferase domain-containing protein